MNFRHPRYILILIPMIFSWFLTSCGSSLNFNKTPAPILEIETTASPSITATKAYIPVRIPREYLPSEEFLGYYTASFEVSSFVPCSENDLPGYGKGYWIDFFQSSSFHENYNTIVAETNQNTNQAEDLRTIVFVRFVGQLSNPFSIEEHHGHMGLYKQEIVVSELIEMMPVEENQCTSS